MSSLNTSMRCLWYRCPCADPFQTDRELFEHLRAEHSHCGGYLSPDFPFVCQWAGCAYSSSDPRERTLHLISHTDYRPWVCPHAGCGRAYASAAGIYKHRTEHTKPVDQVRRCYWTGCGTPLAAISDLSEHMERHAAGVACGMRCEWEGCVYIFPRTAHLKHIWTHLPDRPRPFACFHCDRTFVATKDRAKHVRAAHPRPQPSPAASPGPDDYASDFVPVLALKRPVSPPPPRVMLKLKRRRLKPHSPDDSESELDIALSTPAHVQIKLECDESGHEYDAEIAIAVAHIVDSPAWALAPGRRAAKGTWRGGAAERR